LFRTLGKRQHRVVVSVAILRLKWELVLKNSEEEQKRRWGFHWAQAVELEQIISFGE
jgi:hypothetical protein